MRVTFIVPKLGEAFGQERATDDSIALLQRAGHPIHVLEDEAASRLHSLSPLAAVREANRKIQGKLAEQCPDIVHFVDQFDFRIMRQVARTYPTILTAHTVAPTCPASHRLIYRQEVCPERSGLKCLMRNKSYGCLRHFKNDGHRLNSIQNYLFKRWALKQFEGIIAISKYIEDTLTFDGFEKHRVFQIYNAVKAMHATPLPNTPKNLIVTASRLTELKGTEFTIRALKLIEDLDWTFWILGDGPEKKRLESLSDELGLNRRISFRGQTTRKDTEAIMSAASLVTQTNVGPEGFGLSVAEAQALGKPVVAFNVPALNEIIVHGETGFLVPPRNINELGEAIRTLLMDESLRTLLGAQAATQMARAFSPESHLLKTLKTYNLCVESWRSVNRKNVKSLSISVT